MIWSAQLAETIQFYTETLGFTVISRNDEFGWASLQKDEVVIMVSSPNAHTPFEKPVFTGSFYFNTDDVDGLWEVLKTKTGIVYEIQNFAYGMREFAIYDNNGYTLQFGQEIPDPNKPEGVTYESFQDFFN